MREEYIKLRAHHGMCLTFFEGKGYNKEFSEHMQSVLNALQEDTELQIIAEADIICCKCPNYKDSVCSTPDLVKKYDRQVLDISGLKANSIITWKEFSELIADKIFAKGKRDNICGDCEWTEICKAKEYAYRR